MLIFNKYICLLLRLSAIGWWLAVFPAIGTAQKIYTPIIGDPLLESWRWHHFEELDSRHINDLTEDENGNMWFCSARELIMYDGYTFTSDSIPVDPMYRQIFNLESVREGVIVQGAHTNHLFKDKQWYPMIIDSIVGDNVRYYSCIELDSACYLFGTSIGILFENKGKRNLYTTSYIKQLSIDSSLLKTILLPVPLQDCKRIDIWQIDHMEDGIRAILNADQKGYELKIDVANDCNSLSIKVIDAPWVKFRSTSMNTVAGERWIINRLQNYKIYHFSNGDSSEYSMVDKFGDRDIHSSIVELDDGTILIGGEGQLYTYIDDTWRRYSMPEIPVSSTSYIHFCKTRNGDLWIGGAESRFFKLELAAHAWQSYHQLFYQLTDANNNNWFISSDNKVVLHANDQWFYYDQSDGIPSHPTAIRMSPDQHIVCSGAHHHKAAIAFLTGKSWEKFELPALLGPVDKRAAIFDNQGNLWLASIPGQTSAAMKILSETIDKIYTGANDVNFNIPEFTPDKTLHHTLPGIIEAEDFALGGNEVAYSETNKINEGQIYRMDESVDIQISQDSVGIYNVGWINSNEWIKYSIKEIKAGWYTISVRASKQPKAPANIAFYLNNTKIGTIEIAYTGGWQVWKTFSIDSVWLDAALDAELKVVFPNGNLNVNYFSFNNGSPIPNKEHEPVPYNCEYYSSVSASVGICNLNNKIGIATQYELFIFPFHQPLPQIPRNKFSYLTSTPSGDMWFCSEDNGLFRISDDSIYHYTINNGLTSNVLVYAYADTDSTLWLASELDIMRYDGNTWIKYALPMEFNIEKEGGEIRVDKNGLVWISVIPKSWVLKGINQSTSAYLHNEKFFSVRFFPDTISPIAYFLHYTETVQQDGNTHISWDGADYNNQTSKEGLLFSYKFSTDSTWSPFTPEHEKTFLSLSHGYYTLSLRAMDKFGNISSNPAEITFRVLTKVWMRWWFILMVSIFIIVVVILLQNIIKRNQKLFEANIELQEQKEEIATQNEEIQQQNDEMLIINEQLEKQKVKVIDAFHRFEMLSEFGQKLTATLETNTLHEMLYNYLSKLIGIDALGIGLYNEVSQVIRYDAFIENGRRLPVIHKKITDPNSLSAWCVRNQVAVFINDLEKQYTQYVSRLNISSTHSSPKSLIHIPLTVGEKRIGLLAVNNFKKNAYKKEDLNNLQILASYVAIALDNAAAYEIIRNINHSIKESIHYAQSIQDAFLPSILYINKFFEAAVLFRPKDIVSGDFYWFSPIEKDPAKPKKLFLAVADCTGHGVPGALISTIGNNIINRVINIKKILNPMQALEFINVDFQLALQQDQTRNNDGMDLALAYIEQTDDQHFKVVFAGAKSHLLIHRQENNSIELYKGARKSIGGIRAKYSKEFYTNIEITAQKGDSLYLFTDGIVDQHSPKRERFTRDRLLGLIAQNALNSINQQVNLIDEAFVEHMNNERLTDDVTLFAIRL